MSQRLVVQPGAASERLDVYLASALGVSRTSAANAIKAGRVTINNVPARASQLVEGQQVIEVASAKAQASQPKAPTPDLPIVYEDNELLVIDKPAGVVAHAGSAQPLAGTVADFARERTTDSDPERPGIVHRLDKDTSGLMVIAKTVAAKTALQQHWRDREVQKTYRLLVVGRIEPAAAVINLPLDRDPAVPTRRAVLASGRPAVTRYQTLAAYPGYTLLEAYPETGRTHQLRVHFAAVGHPIAGDTTYGVPTRPLGLRRQFLHAAALSFTTPAGHPLHLTSPLPPELQSVLDHLTEIA